MSEVGNPRSKPVLKTTHCVVCNIPENETTQHPGRCSVVKPECKLGQSYQVELGVSTANMFSFPQLSCHLTASLHFVFMGCEMR